MHAFFETHIEQGPILEAEGQTIGAVTDAQGQRWYELTLTGQESPAGPTPTPTPMPMPVPVRRDALLGAAKVIRFVNEIGLRHAPLAVSTVGVINSYPNSRNVIPGKRFLTVDFRCPANDELTKMDSELKEGVAKIAAASWIEHELTQIFQHDCVHFDESCVAMVRAGAEAMGYSTQHRLGRRTRRLLHVDGQAHRDDLRVLHRRHQPQRDRRREARVDRSGRQRAVPGDTAKANELPAVGLNPETVALA